MDASELLRSAKVEVAADTFTLFSLTRSAWHELLKNPELSPRMEKPFMIFMDGSEVTLLLDDRDASALSDSSIDLKKERGFRLITFDLVMGFDVVGFLALITKILADAGISVFAVSSFSRDHILVKQFDLANALKALGPHVSELC